MNWEQQLCAVFSSRKHPPGKFWAFEKIRINLRAPGEFLLKNAPPPVPTSMVKCTGPQSIRLLYKNIRCHFLMNITISAQQNCIKQR